MISILFMSLRPFACDNRTVEKPVLLDLFCGAGGCSWGYSLAGFRVIGVDLEPQPHYPFEFHCMDWTAGLERFGWADAFAASPPCQSYSTTKGLGAGDHPRLIEPVRRALEWTGKPYIIENVVGAPLIDPVLLCGTMFGLRTYRHRLFEADAGTVLEVPEHPEHEARVAAMGRPIADGEFITVAGNFIGADDARIAMGIDWMTRDELAQAIPPAYTWHLGKQINPRGRSGGGDAHAGAA